MRRAAAGILVLLFASCVTTPQPAPEPAPEAESPAPAQAEASPPAPASPQAAAEPEAPAAPEAPVPPTEPAPPAPTAEAAPPPLPEVPQLSADEHLREGTAALKVKNPPLAISHLRACVAQAPDRVDCQWELGWAYYLHGDWEEVVTAWEAVKKLQPDHPDVDGRLADARNQLELRRKLEAMEKEAPAKIRTPPPSGATVRIRAVGDVMLGTDFPEGYMPPDDGAHLLDGVKDWLQDADLTFVNLEGPLCDNPRPSDKCRKGGNCYAFRTPTRYVKYLVEAGVDLASTANNHSGDFGEPCRRETEATLDKVGIKWSGAPGTIATVESNGLKVAMIGFHTSPATNDVNDHKTAAVLVRAAAARHDIVIVSFHGGAEGAKAIHVPHGREVFFGENRGDLRTFTRVVVDAGADLVLGHGPHVLRAMEVYNDRLIAYSLGNFATYGRFTLTGALGVGAVLEVVLDAEGKFVSGKILPTRQIGEGVPVKDPKNTAINYVRMLSREDFPQTGVEVDAEGGVGKPQKPRATR